jgi:hypothetical protein
MLINLFRLDKTCVRNGAQEPFQVGKVLLNLFSKNLVHMIQQARLPYTFSNIIIIV